MKDNTTAKKVSKIDRLINGIEAVCNKLPPPAILFCWLFLFTAVIGAIFTMTGLTLTNPASGEAVTSANLFTTEGLHWFLDNMVKNFTGFAPLGLVITMTLGIGLCEESGMLISLLNSSLKNVPAALVPYVVAFHRNRRQHRFRHCHGGDPAHGRHCIHGRGQAPRCGYDGWLRRRPGRFYREPDGSRNRHTAPGPYQ